MGRYGVDMALARTVRNMMATMEGVGMGNR